ncbi:glycosyltransferase family 4 protein [Streptomyces sp. NP160]|uniref:glycosyltransferase family 4 protein n=1 Tax=Streptomyces sp. NP160 TaxID=2586637 RepID=UPI00111915B6|nr:glycosyltransferase family 4 protein [Streptomyces sp. NP160]TNM67475.1 glycosyltransferase family 4 protein [Streptomyces sp. NP160]
MRIVLDVLEPSRLGGIEVTLLEDVRGLSARGHDLHVVHGPARYRPAPGDLHDDLLAAGAHLHGPHRVAWSPGRTPSDLAAYAASARLLRRLRPDVLWVQRFEHLAWAHAARSATRTPLVCHLHHAPMYRRPVQRLLAAGVGRHLAVSEFTRRQWVDAGLPVDRVGVLHNALPAGGYPPGGAQELRTAREQLGLPAEARVVLLYGLLVEGKGAGVVARAWQELQAAEPSAHLLVAGDVPQGHPDGGLPGVLEAAVAAGRATRLGVQRDVVPLLHAADVVLFPSLMAESFGRVPLEALSTARPVVASRTGAVPEVLAGAPEGLLVPPGDPAALVAAVRSLLRWRDDDDGLGDRLAALARRFDAERRWDALEAELASAAGQPPPGPGQEA